MEDYLIRPVEPRDVERVIGIISRHDESEGELARDYLDAYFQDPLTAREYGRHYVVELDEEIVAVGGYLCEPVRGEFWVGFLVVDPYYQGQGIGSLLLERFDADVRSLDGAALHVAVPESDVLKRSARFYEVNGFNRCDDVLAPPLPMKSGGQIYRKPLVPPG